MLILLTAEKEARGLFLRELLKFGLFSTRGILALLSDLAYSMQDLNTK